MPNAYRVKQCLQCGKSERMRGKFCSVACSNIHRGPHTPESIEKMSDAASTPERIANLRYHARKYNEYRKTGENTTLTDEDWMISIPDLDGPTESEKELDDFFRY